MNEFVAIPIRKIVASCVLVAVVCALVGCDSGGAGEAGGDENSSPSAQFSVAPESPVAGDSVRFTDESTDADGRVASWAWDFGDDTASSDEQNPTHIFAAADTFAVTLTVTDDAGATSSMTEDVAVISEGGDENSSPSAQFSLAPESPVAGDSVRFTDESTDADGSVAFWAWDFGDDTASSNEQNPVHPYDEAGTYMVELTVTDDAGTSNSTTQEVEVISKRDALVGTWTSEDAATETYLEASAAQMIIDPRSEGDGELVLTGDLEATLRYLRRIFPTSSGELAAAPVLASEEPVGEFGVLPLPGSAQSGMVQVRFTPGLFGLGKTARLYVGAEAGYEADDMSDVSFDDDAHTLTFDAATFSDDEGGSVTVDGTLTAATQQLPAGEEALVDAYTLQAPGLLTVTFAEDGTFDALIIGPNGTQSSRGRWAVDEGTLTITSSDGSGLVDAESAVFEVGRDELLIEDLTNVILQVADVTPEQARFLFEQVYGVRTGTLTTFEQRSDVRFSSAN